MKKFKVLTQPTRLTDISFEDLDETDTTEFKSERWEARRWRELKYQ